MLDPYGKTLYREIKSICNNIVQLYDVDSSRRVVFFFRYSCVVVEKQIKQHTSQPKTLMSDFQLATYG